MKQSGSYLRLKFPAHGLSDCHVTASLCKIVLHNINVKLTRNQYDDNVVSINKMWRWGKTQKDMI